MVNQEDSNSNNNDNNVWNFPDLFSGDSASSFGSPNTNGNNSISGSLDLPDISLTSDIGAYTPMDVSSGTTDRSGSIDTSSLYNISAPRVEDVNSGSGNNALNSEYMSAATSALNANAAASAASTTIGWANFGVAAVSAVANIAMSIKNYNLAKDQFKQTKKAYAYNVEKNEQAIYDNVQTRAMQGVGTAEEKAAFMRSKGVDPNKYGDSGLTDNVGEA